VQADQGTTDLAPGLRVPGPHFPFSPRGSTVSGRPAQRPATRFTSALQSVCRITRPPALPMKHLVTNLRSRRATPVNDPSGFRPVVTSGSGGGKRKGLAASTSANPSASMVAGARNAEYYTEHATYWIDLR
jgi:hypothetical protein